MVDPTPRRMTLSKFLAWEHGTDTRYEPNRDLQVGEFDDESGAG